jgi:aryl-alcohol dehydrogenase-like predicted oxidoreductase
LLVELGRGTIDAIGVSNWSVDRFRALRTQLSASGADGPPVFSNHFSLVQMGEPPWPGCLAMDAGTARDLVRSEVTVLAWASLAGGYLSSDTGSLDAAIRRSWDTPENRERRTRTCELARQLGVAPAAVAVAYVLAHDGVRPVIGTRSPEHLAEALAAETLDLRPEQLAQLEGLG